MRQLSTLLQFFSRPLVPSDPLSPQQKVNAGKKRCSPPFRLHPPSPQQKLIAGMREELGMSKEHRAMAESQSDSRGTQLADLKVSTRET